MISTVTDVEKALADARELEEYWINEGWQSLQLEEEIMTNEVLDVYPLIEVDISVTITIKLSDKIYSVPLEDVSSLSVNDCLVIGVSDLYPDWEERVRSKLGSYFYEKRFTKNDEDWFEFRYVDSEGIVRIVKAKTI